MIVALCVFFVMPWSPGSSQQIFTQVVDSPDFLCGKWEIFKTKEPGKPYRSGFRGRPFVRRGPHAFTLILEYRDDGTFRKVSRIAGKEVVREGEWSLTGHELRQKTKGRSGEEVVYVRFDGPNVHTLVEVYEKSPHPGLFAKFRRISN